jgi:hypothetical protein
MHANGKLSNHYCHGCHATQRFLLTYDGEKVQKKACGVCGREIVVAKFAHENREQRLSREMKEVFQSATRRYW